MVKNLPAMQKTWVQSLKKDMATLTVFLKIPWTEELGELQSMGFQRVEHDSATFSFKVTLSTGKKFMAINAPHIHTP